MRSQSIIVVLALAAGEGCGNVAAPTMTHISLPIDAPDLSLRGVAFARLSEGRMVSRGIADRLDYRRAGGRLTAERGAAQLWPERSSGLAPFGWLKFQAPSVDGEIANRRGHRFRRVRGISGGLRLHRDAARQRDGGGEDYPCTAHVRSEAVEEPRSPRASKSLVRRRLNDAASP